LRKYGRPVSECAYYAMTHGPVPSEAKHIAEGANRLPLPARSYARKFIRRKSAYEFASLAGLETAVLSESDLEALNFAWQKLRSLLPSISFATSLIITRSGSATSAPCRKTGIAASRWITPTSSTTRMRATSPATFLTDKEREVARELFVQRQAFDQRWS